MCDSSRLDYLFELLLLVLGSKLAELSAENALVPFLDPAQNLTVDTL